ncbi:MAG: sugar phosphate isomerase/epimerase family protein [Saprospiraceae bacterium]|jgi:D-psicose/D-tagatose/L-ribulose 3-epimerase
MKKNRRAFINQLTTMSTLPLLVKNPEDMLTHSGLRPKIGFNLLAWSAVISDKLYPVVDKLKTLGYDGVECAMDERNKAVYKTFGNHMADLGLQATAVLAVGADENPVSTSAFVRAKALDRLKGAIDCAHELNAKNICGPFHSAFATFTRKPPEEQEYAWSAEVLHEAGVYAASAQITLTLEALNRFECYLCNTMDQLSKLVNQVNHPNVKAMFDTHHANMEEKKFAAALKNIAPLLGHVHISENDRGTPGDGHILWDDTFATLAAIRYKGWLTIEAFTRNDPNFANAINVWREYSKPWDMAEHGIIFIKRMIKKHQL